ncbi:MAG: hypothetical protein QOI95_2065 [Acidimicrobiaceae bacterium]|jgi:pimeloyl-ACP methyl ester carboxylesterase
MNPFPATSDRSSEVATSAGRIRYNERGCGEPLVFLHALFTSSTMWGPVIDVMSAEYRCIALELPLGSHEIAMARDADLSPPGLARIVDEACDALGLGAVTLVGGDTGGAIAQLVAVNHADRVKRLVLAPCDAFDNFAPPTVFRLLRLMARLPGGMRATGEVMRVRPLWRLPITLGWLTKRPLRADIVRAWWRPVRRSAGVRRDVRKVIRGIDSKYTIDAAERLKGFAKPALVVWTPEDRLFPLRHGEQLASLLPAGQLEIIDDSYSLLSLDQPVELARLITQFVHQTAEPDREEIHRERSR